MSSLRVPGPPLWTNKLKSISHLFAFALSRRKDAKFFPLIPFIIVNKSFLLLTSFAALRLCVKMLLILD
jgi:hypothetical protein